MTDTGLPWREVAEIPDPLARVRQIDAEVAYAKQLRGIAVLQLYADYGATEAARMLDMSRANVYRVVAELLQERPDIDFDTVIAKRHADQGWKNIAERFHSTANRNTSIESEGG